MAVRLVLFTSQAVASPNQWRFEAGCGLSSAAASSRATENEAAESSRGRISRWLGDDSGAARKQFVEHRMRLACRREQPRAGEYLDQRGRIRYANEGGGAPAAG